MMLGGVGVVQDLVAEQQPLLRSPPPPDAPSEHPPHPHSPWMLILTSLKMY